MLYGMKSRRRRWAKHVECMGERRVEYRFCVRKPDGKRPLVNLRFLVGVF
jgi:hypothetical protein